MQIKLELFQDDFLFCERRFPALIAGVGTGKTLLLLGKCMRWAEKYPGAPCLIVRKEFTDLRDSTLKDFNRYFGKEVDSHKEYHLPNKSYIMFRHGGELNVLKNMNLSFVGIEQAEEFESDEQFQMLRDRLRHDAAFRMVDKKRVIMQQMAIIANANGHNWCYRLWVNNPAVDGSYASTKLCRPISPEYVPTLAQTFDNEKNLPRAFVVDLAAKETEAPNYFKQYIKNRFDVSMGDRIFTPEIIKLACEKHGKIGYYSGNKGAALDPSGEGADDNVICAGSGGEPCLIDGKPQWKQTISDPQSNGQKCLDVLEAIDGYWLVIDCDGMGIRDYQLISSWRNVTSSVDIIKYHGSAKSDKVSEVKMPDGSTQRRPTYANIRTEAAFNARDRILKGTASIDPNNLELIEDLEAMEYTTENGVLTLIPKEKIKERLNRSPGCGDAWIMFQWGCSLNLVRKAVYSPSVPGIHHSSGGGGRTIAPQSDDSYT